MQKIGSSKTDIKDYLFISGSEDTGWRRHSQGDSAKGVAPFKVSGKLKVTTSIGGVSVSLTEGSIDQQQVHQQVNHSLTITL